MSRFSVCPPLEYFSKSMMYDLDSLPYLTDNLPQDDLLIRGSACDPLPADPAFFKDVIKFQDVNIV
jgi:hypothetical protein